MSSPTVSLSPSADSLWKECHALEHEMILTVAGRRIFPTLEFMASGLDAEKTYSVCFHLEQVDDKRLRFTNKVWQEALSTETRDAPRKIWHPQGAQSGKEWMDRAITFDHVRITNKKSKELGNASYIHLHTQHRYMPVLEIFECTEGSSTLVSTTRIPHSMFITVTAYHKSEINILKTNNNPYSTGSRKERRRTRDISPATSDGSSSSSGSSECSLTPPPAKRVKADSPPLTPVETPTPTPSPSPMEFQMMQFQLQQAYFMQYFQQLQFNQFLSMAPQMNVVKEDTVQPPREEQINILDV